MMKRTLTMAVALLTASTVLAIDKADLERRIEKHMGKFEVMQAKKDKAVPADVLQKAKGLVLLDRTKAGFIFAYQGGSGLALVKDKAGNWSPVAFMQANEGSVGFQVGGQQSFLVMALMNDDATRLLTDPKFEFGGEARGTAGDASTGASGEVTTSEAAIQVYDDRAGLFGGAALKGGALSADTDANKAAYGEPLTVKEILFDKKPAPTEASKKLIAAIEASAKGEKK